MSEQKCRKVYVPVNLDVDAEGNIRPRLIRWIDGRVYEICLLYTSSPSKGKITLFLKHEQDSVKFILEDEGPGIEDDVKSRIFDKFYQVDGSHKAEGNGLGLALVKRIVDSAGGTIKAENREYGGCRFVIELPKQKDVII